MTKVNLISSREHIIFGSLRIGEWLMTNSIVAIKTGPAGVVDIETGNYVTVSPDHSVIPIRTVTIKYEA